MGIGMLEPAETVLLGALCCLHLFLVTSNHQLEISMVGQFTLGKLTNITAPGFFFFPPESLLLNTHQHTGSGWYHDVYRFMNKDIGPEMSGNTQLTNNKAPSSLQPACVQSPCLQQRVTHHCPRRSLGDPALITWNPSPSLSELQPPAE